MADRRPWTIDWPTLNRVLDACPGWNVALAGDLFLDRYLEIDAEAREYSVETGLEAYQVRRVRNSPGALGTVMNNLAALGVGRLTPVTLIGDDGHGYDLLRELARLPVDTQHIVRSPRRLTPTYTKPLLPDPKNGGWRELNRLDVRSGEPPGEAEQEELCRRIADAFRRCDALVVLDQVVEDEWGVVGRRVRRLLEELAAEQPGKLICADSRAHLGRFRCGVLKGNRSEVLAAAGDAGRQVGGEEEQAAVEAAARALAARTGRPAFCTLGEQGVLAALPDGAVHRSPAVPVQGPVDIVGAGDSATAGIVLALLAGAAPAQAADLANLVASITVQQLGRTGVATPDQVRRRWREATSRRAAPEA